MINYANIQGRGTAVRPSLISLISVNERPKLSVIQENIPVERTPNPPSSVPFLRVLFLQRAGITGDSTKPAVLSKKVCSVLIHVGFSREFWSLPAVPCSRPEPGLRPGAVGVSLTPCPRSIPFQIQMSSVTFLVPTRCSRLLSCFFFHVSPAGLQ